NGVEDDALCTGGDGLVDVGDLLGGIIVGVDDLDAHVGIVRGSLLHGCGHRGEERVSVAGEDEIDRLGRVRGQRRNSQSSEHRPGDKAGSQRQFSHFLPPISPAVPPGSTNMLVSKGCAGNLRRRPCDKSSGRRVCCPAYFAESIRACRPARMRITATKMYSYIAGRPISTMTSLMTPITSTPRAAPTSVPRPPVKGMPPRMTPAIACSESPSPVRG